MVHFDISCFYSYEQKHNFRLPSATRNTTGVEVNIRPTRFFEDGEDIRRCLIRNYRFIHDSMASNTIQGSDSIFTQNNNFCTGYFPYFLGFAFGNFIFRCIACKNIHADYRLHSSLKMRYLKGSKWLIQFWSLTKICHQSLP